MQLDVEGLIGAGRYPLSDSQAHMAVLGSELADRVSRNVPQDDRSWSYCGENLDTLHRSGYLRLALPREYGGEGVDMFSMMLAQERLAPR
jgi:alkylation response protein AidB-like acyl-CoA dehydrogenase